MNNIPGPQLREDLTFTAIDFETANQHFTSACSVGIARFEKGELVETFHEYIRPYPNYFNFWNTKIHSITSSDCDCAPSFVELWPKIKHFINDQIVVGHNVTFERNVLNHLDEKYELGINVKDYLCSLKAARVEYNSLSSHKLSYVMKEVFHKEINHHNALDDAIASGVIIKAIVEEWNPNSFEGFVNALPLSEKKDRVSKKPKIKFSQILPEDGFEGNDLLKGKTVAFTGNCGGSKYEMAQIVVNYGGKAQENLIKSTKILVVGTYGARGDEYISGKHARAHKYIDQGQNIEIIPYEVFYERLGIPCYHKRHFPDHKVSWYYN